MRYAGQGVPLKDTDISKLAKPLGLEEDDLRAVIEVECRGRGFDRHRRPAMLFEPHQFYRRLPQPQRAEAEARALAYPLWGERPYPPDSYPRLEMACKIDGPAALRSASWGLGQVMGFNYAQAGYDSAANMVTDFMLGEYQQLQGMLRFIVAQGLDEHLRNHDWRAFARGYNGASYAVHAYHTRLQAAYVRWGSIPDTPWLQQEPERLPIAPSTPQRSPEIAKTTGGSMGWECDYDQKDRPPGQGPRQEPGPDQATPDNTRSDTSVSSGPKTDNRPMRLHGKVSDR